MLQFKSSVCILIGISLKPAYEIGQVRGISLFGIIGKRYVKKHSNLYHGMETEKISYNAQIHFNKVLYWYLKKNKLFKL